MLKISVMEFNNKTQQSINTLQNFACDWTLMQQCNLKLHSSWVNTGGHPRLSQTWKAGTVCAF